MGREIRRVPPNWEHPMQNCPHHSWRDSGCAEARHHGGKCFMPMRDKDFETAMDEWIVEYQLWKKGEHPYQDDENRNEPYWECYASPPNPDYYRPKFDEEPTWYQIYETVSEGTPVTPPFATKEELVEYLVANGDYWDQYRGDGGWSRESAESFVKHEFAVSFMVTKNSDGSVDMKAPRDGQF